MTTERAASSPQVLRRINSEALLARALTTGAFDASAAMLATGLTRSTVLALCEELVRLGWLVRLDDSRAAGEYSKGRPASRWELQPRAGHVVGVDAGQHTVSAVVADLRGDFTGGVHLAVAEDAAPDVRREITRTAVLRALDEASVEAGSVFATVIGVPAPVDGSGRSPSGDDHYWTTMNPGLVDAFDGLGEVVVDNDANLAAIAEQALGAGRDVDSFAALLSGERFGAGLVVDRALLRGRHGGAGEMRVLNLVEGVGSADGLGALARDLARTARAEERIAADSPLAAVPTAELGSDVVFAAASAGDPTALAIVRTLGQRLARVCLVLSSLIDVERVVLSGALAAAAGPVIEEARGILRTEFYPPVPELVASSLGAETVVLGAVQRGVALVRAAPLDFRVS
ncbi:ROK family protein [Frondihabitans peucedani]|uniref:ROK family protein n=1 Tax=Frondihabitans peucedani TaxID=598626 RepID=A0ABP8E5J6_9MICO